MSVNTNRAVAQSPAGVCLSVVGGGGVGGLLFHVQAQGPWKQRRITKVKEKREKLGSSDFTLAVYLFL